MSITKTGLQVAAILAIGPILFVANLFVPRTTPAPDNKGWPYEAPTAMQERGDDFARHVSQVEAGWVYDKLSDDLAKTYTEDKFIYMMRHANSQLKQPQQIDCLDAHETEPGTWIFSYRLQNGTVSHLNFVLVCDQNNEVEVMKFDFMPFCRGGKILANPHATPPGLEPPGVIDPTQS